MGGMVDGAQDVINWLNNLATKAKAAGITPNVIVGYEGVNYAIYVHEDLTANHPNGGEAKYLEKPYRKNLKTYHNIIIEALKRGETLVKSLMLAGLALQADSQALVPVDTGFLRGSAFTRLEK
jgi:hypothetical protein